MKHIALLAALAALLIANQRANAQGALNPPGAPTESQKSLQEIYDAISEIKRDVGILTQFVAQPPPGMVTVVGGKMPQGSQLNGQTLATFFIGKHEVTWSEWQEVREWAITKGYTDLAIAGAGSAPSHPVQRVSWYDVLKWCNAKSEKENLTPVYRVNNAIYKTGGFGPLGSGNVQSISSANGYRLPTDVEWEWAARGGIRSQGYTYSGSDDINAVAHYWFNSMGSPVIILEDRGTWPVGVKLPNEIGIHDMSGNVWEWVFDPNGDNRRIRGGSWNSFADGCVVNWRGSFESPGSSYNFIGFRFVRNF